MTSINILQPKYHVDNFIKGVSYISISSAGSHWIFNGMGYTEKQFNELRELLANNKYKHPDLFLDRNSYNVKQVPRGLMVHFKYVKSIAV